MSPEVNEYLRDLEERALDYAGSWRKVNIHSAKPLEFLPDPEWTQDIEVEIKRETLEGLRDAYIVVATTQSVGPEPYEALESWIVGVLEEAVMAETVRQAIQKDWQERRKRREAEMAKSNPDEYLLMP